MSIGICWPCQVHPKACTLMCPTLRTYKQAFCVPSDTMSCGKPSTGTPGVGWSGGVGGVLVSLVKVKRRGGASERFVGAMELGRGWEESRAAVRSSNLNLHEFNSWIQQTQLLSQSPSFKTGHSIEWSFVISVFLNYTPTTNKPTKKLSKIKI